MSLYTPFFAPRCTTPARRKPRIGARVERLTLAAIALLLMVYGEQWLLQQAPATADELTLGTCMIDAVDGTDARANVCVSDLSIHDEAAR
jgi:hypothetical protein